MLRSKSVLSMDFGSRSIKMAEGTYKNGKLNILRTLFMDLPHGVYEDGHIKDNYIISHTLDTFLKMNDIKVDSTIAVVSSSDILTRDITIPSVAEKEIDGILKYKITDYIPIDPEEYIVQYINEGTFMEGGNEKIKLFIVAMPKSIAEQHFELLKKLDLKPKVLDLQSNAIRKLVSFDEKNQENHLLKGKTIASIDIGYFSTKLTVLKKGKIKISRNILTGVKDILDNIDYSLEIDKSYVLNHLINLSNNKDDVMQTEKIIEVTISLNSFLSSILESIDMVFRYYNSQEASNEVDLIILQGSIVNISEVKDRFENYLNIKTISMDSLHGIVAKDLHLYSNAIGSLIRGEII